MAALRACFVSPDRFQGCVSRDQTLPPVRLIILEVHGGFRRGRAANPRCFPGVSSNRFAQGITQCGHMKHRSLGTCDQRSCFSFVPAQSDVGRCRVYRVNAGGSR